MNFFVLSNPAIIFIHSSSERIELGLFLACILCWSLTLHWPVFRIPACVDIHIWKPTLVEFYLFVLFRRVKMNSDLKKTTPMLFLIFASANREGECYANKILNYWGTSAEIVG